MFQRYEFNLTYLIALCAFDILLTFPREVKCIWQRPFSAISVIYPIIRYCPLGSAILRSIPIMWRSMDLVVSTFAYLVLQFGRLLIMYLTEVIIFYWLSSNVQPLTLFSSCETLKITGDIFDVTTCLGMTGMFSEHPCFMVIIDQSTSVQLYACMVCCQSQTMAGHDSVHPGHVLACPEYSEHLSRIRLLCLPLHIL